MNAKPLTLRHDWPERLTAFIESRRHTPFQWGFQDCGLFAADGILEMTGVDLASALRGYKTERGALSRIRKAGGMRGLASALTERAVGFAQRGNLVLVDLEGRETFGLVSGNNHWCGPGRNGLLFRPMNEALAAFGV